MPGIFAYLSQIKNPRLTPGIGKGQAAPSAVDGRLSLPAASGAQGAVSQNQQLQGGPTAKARLRARNGWRRPGAGT